MITPNYDDLYQEIYFKRAMDFLNANKNIFCNFTAEYTAWFMKEWDEITGRIKNGG